jgi:type IV pilus assembly protein PilE
MKDTAMSTTMTTTHNPETIRTMESNIRTQPVFARHRPVRTIGNGGFSLIEIMIVVVIIAILAAIAIPIYQKQVQESRRTAARTGLLDLASREEKYFSTNNVYVASLSTLGYPGAGTSITVPNNTPSSDYYTITVTLTGATTPGTNFTATATPISNSTQATDACGNYTLTDLGIQGNSVSPNTGCW